MGIRDFFGKQLVGLIKKYDVNFWVNFIKTAHQEDQGRGGGVSDVMRQSAWANIAVTAVARNLARAEFQIYLGDDPIERGPEYELFTNVNPYMSRYQLWEATFAWMKIRGECIWIFEDGYTRGLPKAIYPVDPAMWTHKLTPDGRAIAPTGMDPPPSQLNGPTCLGRPRMLVAC